VSWPWDAARAILRLRRPPRGICWPRTDGTTTARTFRRQFGLKWFAATAIGSLMVAVLSVGLPLTGLVSDERTWNELIGAAKAGQSAIVNSALFAAVAATLAALIGLLTWRWPVGTFLWLPFLVPGVLLGVVLTFIFHGPVLAA